MLTAGIDIGSVSTEMVLLENRDIAGTFIVDTGSSSRNAVEAILARAREERGISRDDIGYVVTTGYGRNSTDRGDRSVTEITCHARGAYRLDRTVRTVVDVGGQDSKVILLGENGRSENFVMNDKCAAGTGRFLEIIARTLEVKVEEMGGLALSTDDGVTISSMCAVFAESEVVSLIAEGHSKERIINGIMDAIATRVSGMAKRLGYRPPVMFTGGVANNAGVVRSLRRCLDTEILVPEQPQMVGALGAALIAMEEACRV